MIYPATDVDYLQDTTTFPLVKVCCDPIAPRPLQSYKPDDLSEWQMVGNADIITLGAVYGSYPQFEEKFTDGVCDAGYIDSTTEATMEECGVSCAGKPGGAYFGFHPTAPASNCACYTDEGDCNPTVGTHEHT